MTRKRTLVTGSGRSGTKFISTLMSSQGYDMRHEGHDPRREGTCGEGTACWFCCMVLEPNVARNEGVTRCACRFPDFLITSQGEPNSEEPTAPINAHYDLILHQVRTPLNVIGSLLTTTEGSWDYIDNKIGVYHLDDPILRATRYWIEWNRHAGQIANHSYRVEDIKTELPVICDMIGLEYNEASAHYILKQPPIHSRTHPMVTADDIKNRDACLFQQLEETAALFGYQL